MTNESLDWYTITSTTLPMKIYLYRNGQNYGPYSEKTLSDCLESGLVTKADLACKIGSEEWVKLGDLLEEDDGTSNDT